MKTIKKTSAPQLKVCGVTRLEDVHLCDEEGVDFIGLNFFFASKRRVSAEVGAELCDAATKAKVVGVFVDHQPDEIMAIDEQVKLDVIQMHGQETLAEVRAIRQELAKPVWRAFKVMQPADLELLEVWEGSVDLMLLDGAQPGSGEHFDWRWLEESELPAVPWGLAGGINPDNIRDAIKHRPGLIDIASGVESQPGVKDKDKIRACRQAIWAGR